jgi:hypothetical protein
VSPPAQPLSLYDHLDKDPGVSSNRKPRSTVNPKTEVRRALARRAIHPRWADPSACGGVCHQRFGERGYRPTISPSQQKNFVLMKFF